MNTARPTVLALVVWFSAALSGCTAPDPNNSNRARNAVDPSKVTTTVTDSGIASRMVAVVYYATPKDNDCRNESKSFVRTQVLPRIGPSDEVCWICSHGTFIPDRDVTTTSMPELPASLVQEGRLVTPKDLIEQKQMQKLLARTWQLTMTQRKFLSEHIGGGVSPIDLDLERTTAKPLDYALRRLSLSNASHKYLVLLGNAQPSTFADQVNGLDGVVNLFAVYPGLTEFNAVKDKLNTAFTHIGAQHFSIADKAESGEPRSASRLVDGVGLHHSGVPSRVPLPRGFVGE